MAILSTAKMDLLPPVINRYFRKFETGEIRRCELVARRKNTPSFAKSMQLQLPNIMRRVDTILIGRLIK